MKKLLALALALLMLATLLVACGDDEAAVEDLKDYLKNEEVADFATLESGETYYFVQDDSESVIITAYECSNNEKRDLVVPTTLQVRIGDTNEYKTYTVVGIGNEAFKANNDILSVTLPETVKTIGDYAFAQCSLITSIKIPANVTSIGRFAFSGCASLTDLDIQSDKITEIKDFTFYGCTSLTELTVTANIKTVGTGAFNGCASLKSIVFEEGVQEIGKQAFQNCTLLESLTMPASLTKIGKQAFNGSTKLYDDAVIYAEGATVAKEHFEMEEHMLPERPGTEDEEIVVDTENKNFKILSVDAFRVACPIDWKQTAYEGAEMYKDVATGNYLLVSVVENNDAIVAVKDLTPDLFCENVQPKLESLGIQVSDVAVEKVENETGLSVVKVQMTNTVNGVQAVQTMIIHVGAEKTVQILVTEVAPAAELVETIIDSIATV